MPQVLPADIVAKNSKKFFKLEENEHPYAVKSEAEAKVVRDGNEVHVYMTMIRSHFAPDNIEGIQVGDKVYFHFTNLEQDYDHTTWCVNDWRQYLRIADHAGANRNLYLGTQTRRCLAILLYRFLFSIASGDARVCKGFSERIKCSDLVHFRWRPSRYGII